MATVTLNNTHHKGSTLLHALWSLFFLLTCSLCFVACNSKSESERLRTLDQEVQQMQDCQLHSQNKEFFLHRYKAEKEITKLLPSLSSMSKDNQHTFSVAQSRYACVTADYYLQVGKRKEAIAVLDDLGANSILNLNSDTLQWLDFLCHQAAVRYVPVEIKRNYSNITQGYDCLIQCYILSTRTKKEYYEARSLQLLSRYLNNDSVMNIIKDFDGASLRYINEDGVNDTLLAGNLAERSLVIAQRLNDARLIIESWRHLAGCYFHIGEAESSVQCLIAACNMPGLDSLPDLRASIHEYLSLSYAALDNKHFSDLYRNAYLDAQDSTRQDRMMEARATALEESSKFLWATVGVAFLIFVILCVTTAALYVLRRRKERMADKAVEEIEELQESLAAIQLQYSNAQRAAIEERSRVAVINGMLPLIDRMRLAVSSGNNAYAIELADEIEKQNAMLTQWIKMQQGSISPRIETVDIQQLFNIVMQNAQSMMRHGITLTASPSATKVKADRALTLFIINTLTDNARKAFDEDTNGTIAIRCAENPAEGYAEISVEDNGRGMTEAQLTTLFDYKAIHDSDSAAAPQSHGFALQNCRGIIDRYRKISSLFHVCSIMAESVLGKGTTIRFRLPLAVKMLLAAFFISTGMQATTHHPSPATQQAVRYADSLYSLNVQGRHAEASLYADSCLAILKTNKEVSDSIRMWVYNETAVSALATHQWERYRYYNYLYAALYKESTADNTLPTYCQTMERNKMMGNYVMLVIILLTISLLPIFWFVYLRHIIRHRKGIRQQKTKLQEQVSLMQHEYERLHIINNITANQLSTHKHETMYFPARIRQQALSGDDALASTVTYYRELFATLSTEAMNKQIAAYSFPIARFAVEDIFPAATPSHDSPLTQEETGKRRFYANAELMAYLRLLLKRHNSGKTFRIEVEPPQDNGYIALSFHLANATFSVSDVNNLFATSTPHTDFLVLRQIMREIGNATNHYACGITARYADNTVVITATFPMA